MEDAPAQLIDKLREWMTTTGFPLEMATADAFRREKFEVRQGSIYVDPESGKGRETDVVAIDPDIFGAIDVGFVLECKSSARPWVVLTSVDAAAGFNRFAAFAVTSQSAGAALMKKAENLDSMKYIERPSAGGYGLRQGLAKDGQDNAYAAAMSAVKACIHFVVEAEQLDYKPCALYFPVIVVDSPIFECTLLEDGELSFKQVAMSEFMFSGHVPRRVLCWVKVVERASLPAFAAHARELAASLRADLEDEETARISQWLDRK